MTPRSHDHIAEQSLIYAHATRLQIPAQGLSGMMTASGNLFRSQVPALRKLSEIVETAANTPLPHELTGFTGTLKLSPAERQKAERTVHARVLAARKNALAENLRGLTYEAWDEVKKLPHYHTELYSQAAQGLFPHNPLLAVRGYLLILPAAYEAGEFLGAKAAELAADKGYKMLFAHSPAPRRR